MLIGYARTSTLEQKAGLEAQIESLSAIGCDKVFSEQTSSVAVREALRASIEFSREGDTIVVTKLDRLARSVRHLGELLEQLESKRVMSDNQVGRERQPRWPVAPGGGRA